MVIKKPGNYLRSFFSITGSLLPSFILFTPSKKIILPTYHTISNNTPDHIKHLYKARSEKEFSKDLEFLTKNFKPIDLDTLIRKVHNGEPLPKNYFHLSFDDGLRECSEVIAPILKRKGIPATFFINPAFIDNKGLMHRYKASVIIEETKHDPEKRNAVVTFVKRKLGIRREPINFLLTLRYTHSRFMDEIAQLTQTDFESYLTKQRPYMSTEQVTQLRKDGFTLGAHSMDHPEYFMIPEEEQLRQTTESLQFMHSKFQLRNNVFAFPFTDYKVSSAFFASLYNQPHPLADLTFGVAGLKSDIHPHHLQRIPMEKAFTAEGIIKGEYLYYCFKGIMNKNTIRRK